MRRFERNGTPRIWKGLILVTIGGLLLAYKMGAPIPHWVFSWPMLIIILGFLSGIKNRFHNRGSLIMMAIGAIFLIDETQPSFQFHIYIVPLLLISLGLIYILRPSKWKHRTMKDWRYNYYNDTTSVDKSIVTDDSEYIDINAVFGGVKKNVLSKNFKGGEINSFMGGSEVNLMQADIKQQIVLVINNMFGGTKLIVPSNWDIKNEVTAIFGGVEDKRSLVSITPDPGKIMIIKGSCIFGGIEVNNY